LYVLVSQKASADARAESKSHRPMNLLSGPNGSDTKRIRSTAKSDATKDMNISKAKTIPGLR
jgi:hypothetical protein